jgi:hypothetical protein
MQTINTSSDHPKSRNPQKDPKPSRSKCQIQANPCPPLRNPSRPYPTITSTWRQHGKSQSAHPTRTTRKNLQAQTKKATQNTKRQSGKSQLIRSKTRNLKISSKNQPKTQKTGNTAISRGKV